jgi:hypothetical protein
MSWIGNLEGARNLARQFIGLNACSTISISHGLIGWLRHVIPVAPAPFCLEYRARWMIPTVFHSASVNFRHVVRVAVAEGRELGVGHQAFELAGANANEFFMIARLKENVLGPLLERLIDDRR